METGIVSKPPSGPMAIDHAPSAVGSTSRAVATDLPADKAVTAPAAGAQARNDPARQDHVKNQVLIDPQTRDVIFRVIDVSSRRVVRQLPDEALLRLRAYTRTLMNRDASSATARTDREI